MTWEHEAAAHQLSFLRATSWAEQHGREPEPTTASTDDDASTGDPMSSPISQPPRLPSHHGAAYADYPQHPASPPLPSPSSQPGKSYLHYYYAQTGALATPVEAQWNFTTQHASAQRGPDQQQAPSLNYAYAPPEATMMAPVIQCGGAGRGISSQPAAASISSGHNPIPQ